MKNDMLAQLEEDNARLSKAVALLEQKAFSLNDQNCDLRRDLRRCCAAIADAEQKRANALGDVLEQKRVIAGLTLRCHELERSNELWRRRATQNARPRRRRRARPKARGHECQQWADQIPLHLL